MLITFLICPKNYGLPTLQLISFTSNQVNFVYSSFINFANSLTEAKQFFFQHFHVFWARWAQLDADSKLDSLAGSKSSFTDNKAILNIF